MTEVQSPKEAQSFLFATLRLAIGIRGSLPERQDARIWSWPLTWG